MNFVITTDDSGTTCLSIEGELDAVSLWGLRDDLETLVAQDELHRLRIDLSGLRLIDSSGVGTLVKAYKDLRERQAVLEVVGLQGQPRAVFNLLHLDRVMTEADWR